MEDLKYTPEGCLLTRGPGNYKIPSCTNIPVEFNVTLLKGSSNPKAVYSSKVGSEQANGLRAIGYSNQSGHIWSFAVIHDQ